MKKMKMSETLESAWEETQQLTEDFVKALSVPAATKKLNRPGLDTFAKHVLEMSEVRKAYARALDGQGVDFSSVTDLTLGKKDYVPASVGALLSLLKRSSTEVSKVFKRVDDWAERVDFMGELITKEAILELLLRHEVFHQGQFVAYAYSISVAFPKSWIDAWFLPVRKR